MMQKSYTIKRAAKALTFEESLDKLHEIFIIFNQKETINGEVYGFIGWLSGLAFCRYLDCLIRDKYLSRERQNRDNGLRGQY